MSCELTPILSEKELREIYGRYSKEKLVDAVVERHLHVRTLQDEIMKLTHK